MSPQEVATCLLDQRNPAHNIAALEHRQRLIRTWGIPLGSNILEIGPGQGDFTVALADAVGPAGRIVAIDNAPPGYGKLMDRAAPSLPHRRGLLPFSRLLFIYLLSLQERASERGPLAAF
jgi:tRNA G46 methylase TrmB